MYTTRDKDGVNGYTYKNYINSLKDQLAVADEHEREILLAKIEGATKVAELYRLHSARYRNANREEYKEYQREYHRVYREKNRAKINEYQRARYIKKKNEE